MIANFSSIGAATLAAALLEPGHPGRGQIALER